MFIPPFARDETGVGLLNDFGVTDYTRRNAACSD